MSTIQADVGRHTKVAIVGATVLLAAAAYLAYTYGAAASPQQSSIGAVTTGAGTATVESEHYGEVLGRYNKRNAVAAEHAGETYLSVFSLRPQAIVQSPEQLVPKEPPVSAPAQMPANPVDQLGAPESLTPPPPTSPEDLKHQERLAEQARGLMANWAAVAHSTARVSEADYARSGLQRPVGDQAGAAQPHPMSQVPASIPQVIVPALALVPAILRTDIDTDENSMVEAEIPSGAYAGASVFAMGYKRMNNSVDMTFSLMKWNGHTYRINAKSIDKDTQRSTLSGEVNNRYMSRILLPAIAMGLGRAGQLFEQADTQTIVSPFGGVVQTRSGTPSTQAVAGTVAGGVATEAGQVLRNDAAQQPVRQVVIARNETIGVRFIDPVFASDEVGARASALSAPAPAPDGPAAGSAQAAPGNPSNGDGAAAIVPTRK
jgi:intracellular multiplication protein IcmE